MRYVSILMLWALLLPGCSGDDDGAMGVMRAELRAIEGCDDLEQVLRQSAIDQMREQVMENYRSAINGSTYCYDEVYPGEGEWTAGVDSDGYAPAYESDDRNSGTPDPSGGGDDGAEEYSTTNTQEVGVDEADFVKNDGSFIYMVAGNEFIIIDAWPPPVSEIISRVEIEGLPRLLYVHEDRALIYSDVLEESDDEETCFYDDWYGYRCDVSQGTKITIFDLADKEAPMLVRELVISGQYVNSRRVEDFVHTVMTYPEITFPEVQYWPEGFDYCSAYDRAVAWHAFAELIEENEEIINNHPLEGWVPSMVDTQYDGEGVPSTSTEILGNCEGFFEAAGASGRSFLSVASLDLMRDSGHVNVSSIVGDEGVVYASRDALYVASQQSQSADRAWYFADADEIGEATAVHRFAFDLGSPTTNYEASGVVPGRVLNQFSMGEHQGFLRMATTIGRLPSPDCSNNVYVLEPVDGVLEIVGEITGIAPTEDIRSARFVGDRGFIVTFKKTDPLFTLDLSTPTASRIVGELHIPGYSTYMHMMDSDHLLTIGFDAQDEGSFAWFQGVQLQIFDVSDMSNPTRTHIEIIGTRGTTSEATGNHLAFNYFAPHELLAIPMAICEGGSGGSYGDVMTFNGLLVYDVTVEDGFNEAGGVSHGDAPEGYSCSNWWTDTNSHVKRSIIMDDFVFSIASDQIVVSNVADLSTNLNAVELPLVPDDMDMYGY